MWQGARAIYSFLITDCIDLTVIMRNNYNIAKLTAILTVAHVVFGMDSEVRIVHSLIAGFEVLDSFTVSHCHLS